MKIVSRLSILLVIMSLIGIASANNPTIEGEGDKPLCINVTSITIKAENCDQSNGSITVQHDGTAPFTYTWTPNVSTTNIASNLTAGNYTVKIEDNAGCDAETTLVVTETLAPILQVLSTTDGGCDNGGFATITSSDPTATAVWSSTPAQNGFDLQDVPPGMYTCTVVDSVGCTSLINVTLNPPIPMTLGINSTDDVCGAGNGTATVDVLSSGIVPFSYQWNDPNNQTTQTATGLEAGTYDVTVTDATGCIATASVLVGLQDQLTVNIIVTEPECNGDDNGSIEIEVSNGNGPYNFSWDPDVSRSNIANDLGAGTYRVTISDALGEACDVTEDIVVIEPEPIALNSGFQRSSECGSQDAIAWVNPTNVKGFYTTQWDTFGSSTPLGFQDSLKNIYPGIYIVEVVDSVGCVARSLITVQSDDDIQATVDVQQDDNCGLGQGIARALVSGGTRPFRYQWFTFPIDQDPSSPFAYNLEQGRFFVVVSDANDCVNIDFFDMAGRPPLELESTSSTDNYCNLATGSARATFSGGTPPYEYQWSTLPVQNTQTAVGLAEGNYRVVMSDQNNCKDTAIIRVAEADAFELTTESNDVSCFGDEDGTATVNIEGGLAPFDITWSSDPPQTSPTASNLPAGQYLVTVRDAGGCEQSAFAVVKTVAPVEAEFTYNPDTLDPVILSKAAFAFSNRSNGADRFEWDFGDGNTTEEASPIHVYKDTGQFFVTLRAYNNENRCVDEVVHGPFVVISPGTAFIPSAFTPNSDGVNDDLEFGGVFLQMFDFQLYDRWGRLVWAATSINDTWNGQFEDGSSAPEGVYVYKMRAVGIDQVLFEEEGTITLIR